MSNELFQINYILKTLQKNNSTPQEEIKLVQQMIEYAESYKKALIKLSSPDNQQPHTNIQSDLKLKKISEEVFLYKPVTVKNYYDGDYLERFSSMRTSDLKTSGALEIHNQFWEAHEVTSGNIFASLPLELVKNLQAPKLRRLNWVEVQVDIYEIDSETQAKLPHHVIHDKVEKIFSDYLLVREVYGNIPMILHYKV
ncbi:hypothetical protein [Alkaliphilus serpentinus]|uniref:Uncharacterized protein n=1 Tax=Alkaliphilus serpentinus TaxID=1482731 RepID=A0A833HPL3_9FIRM|nr:hypothetical protein [Alkaliphilus serpentinus]KAB3530877.1 hypothetical protein F8153_05985 [Alkaliphilus serpentinus]